MLCLREIVVWVSVLCRHLMPSLHISSLLLGMLPACQKMSVLILTAGFLAQVMFAALVLLLQTSAVYRHCAGRIKALVFIPVLSSCLWFCVICLVLVAQCTADITLFPCLLNPGGWTHADWALSYCLWFLPFGVCVSLLFASLLMLTLSHRCGSVSLIFLRALT